MGEEAKHSNLKVIWYVLFAIITVILVYLFVVVYFFYISPYNISVKTAIWPFLSDQTVGEMYLDATVEINFTVANEVTFEDEEKKVVGVNVRQDGYIIAPYNEFRSCTDQTEITILANSGKVYNGKFLYGDLNYNIAILKCENVTPDEPEVKIPFVSISNAVSSSWFVETDVLAITSPMESKTVWNGTVSDTNLYSVYKEITIENKYAIDFVMEECYLVDINSSDDNTFEDGAIFDKSGGILGLSFEKTDDGAYVIMPIDSAKYFLNDVVKAYKNQQKYENNLVKSLVGFDQLEIQCFFIASNKNYGEEEFFYFNNTWQVYTDDIVTKFAASSDPGYYVFEDWTYNSNVILPANSVISYIRCNNKNYSALQRTSLFEGLYNADAGDTVTVYYWDIDSLGGTTQSVTFTV